MEIRNEVNKGTAQVKGLGDEVGESRLRRTGHRRQGEMEDDDFPLKREQPEEEKSPLT